MKNKTRKDSRFKTSQHRQAKPGTFRNLVERGGQDSKALRGFTLIELLVVMAIIAVLAGMSLFALQGSRESSRDARRKADLETIRSGVELYRADCGNYPNSGGADFITTFGTDGLQGGEGGCPAGNTNIYISENPSDPVAGRNYYYVSDGLTYTICAGLESDTDADNTCASLNANCGGGTCSYHVVNP